jgi:hypothetical protein
MRLLAISATTSLSLSRNLNHALNEMSRIAWHIFRGDFDALVVFSNSLSLKPSAIKEMRLCVTFPNE